MLSEYVQLRRARGCRETALGTTIVEIGLPLRALRTGETKVPHPFHRASAAPRDAAPAEIAEEAYPVVRLAGGKRLVAAECGGGGEYNEKPTIK